MRRRIDIQQLKPLTDIERGYIAGFIDGEGTITLQIKKRHIQSTNILEYHFHPFFHVGGTDQRPLQWLHKRLGEFGCYCEDKHKKRLFDNPDLNSKTGYKVVYSSTVMRWLLPQIRDVLMIKQAQCDLILQYLELSKDVRGGKQKTQMALKKYPQYLNIFLKIRVLNHRGKNEKEGELGGTLSRFLEWFNRYDNTEPSRDGNVMKFITEGVTVSSDARVGL